MLFLFFLHMLACLLFGKKTYERKKINTMESIEKYEKEEKN